MNHLVNTRLVKNFFLVNAPNEFSLKPAAKTARGNLAPLGDAFVKTHNNARLETRNHARAGRAIPAQRNRLPGNDQTAASRAQQGSVNPAFLAVGVADLPPLIIGARNFDRQAAPLVNPLDRITKAGSRTRINFIGLQGFKTRQLTVILSRCRKLQQYKEH